MNSKHYLTNIYCGKVAQRYGFETAIDKLPIKNSLYLSVEGLAGDECANKEHHGGLERALHQYPAEHYSYWQEKYADHFAANNEANHTMDKAVNWQAAGMGENLSSLGMTEETVCLGDRYQWAEAIIEVSQPRSPCFQLNKRWGIESFSVDMQEISRCGWLYRVIQPGFVSADEPLELIARVSNAMTIKAVCDVFFNDPLNKVGLLQLQQQNTLSNSWMEKVVQRLATNQVESWDFRLRGHA